MYDDCETVSAEQTLLLAARRIDEGAAVLRASLVLTDALRYDEPPGWPLPLPLRYPLSAALLEYGRAPIAPPERLICW